MALFNTIEWNGSGYQQATGGTIIYRAFRIAGLLVNAQQTPPQEWIDDALDILNTIIDSANASHGLRYGIKRNVYSLTMSQQDYTIGPGGDFEHAVVDDIIRAGVVYQDIEYPLSTIGVYDRAAWAYTNSSSLPSSVYFERGDSLGTLSYLYKPYTDMDTTLYLREAIQAFEDQDTAILMRPGYLRYLHYNLAEELALSWPNSKITAMAHKIAIRTTNELKASNSHPNTMKCTPDFTQTGDHLAGSSRRIRLTGGTWQ